MSILSRCCLQLSGWLKLVHEHSLMPQSQMCIHGNLFNQVMKNNYILMTLIILVTSMLISNQQYYSIQNENKRPTPKILQLGLDSPILPEQNR